MNRSYMKVHTVSGLSTSEHMTSIILLVWKLSLSQCHENNNVYKIDFSIAVYIVAVAYNIL